MSGHDSDEAELIILFKRESVPWKKWIISALPYVISKNVLHITQKR